MTFSAYDVVFTPVVADRSFRVHGTVTRVQEGPGRGDGPAVTTYVSAPVSRSEPSGPRPPVTV